MSYEEFDSRYPMNLPRWGRYSELLGPAPMREFEMREQMRLQDPMDAYRPLSQQTSNSPHLDYYK